MDADPARYFEVDGHNEQLLAACAQELQSYAAYHLGLTADQAPQPITKDGFRYCFDRSLPTFAVDLLNCFGGAELLGYAAQNQSRKQANILYFAGPNSGLQVTETGLAAASGIIMLPNGQVVYGKLPEQVPIALVETHDHVLMAQCETLMIPTAANISVYQACTDKRRMDELVPFGSVSLPQRVAIEDLDTFDGQVVIKPARDAQGIGLLIANEQTSLEHLREVYDFLYEAGYEPIIEERIRSYPVYDPHTKAQLDWNVRAIICDGRYVNMYIRADTWGKPVNLSRGALPVMQEAFPDYLRQPDEAQHLINKLEATASRIGETLNRGVLGLDMTLSETGEAYLFEINAGNVGGLQTIIRHERSERRLSDMQTIISSWLERITSWEHTPDGSRQLGALAVSAITLARALQITGQNDAAHAVVPDSPDRFVERYTAFGLLLHARDIACHSLDLKEVKAIDQRLISQHPLELRQQLPYYILETPDPSRFVTFIERLGRLYPDESEWSLCAALIAIHSFDLASAQTASQSMELQNPEWFGRPILAAQGYKEFTQGLAADLPEELQAILMETSVQCVTGGYDHAIQPILSLLESADESLKIVLSHYLTLVSLAAGRYEVAAAAYDRLDSLEATEALLDVMNETNVRMSTLKSRGGIEFRTDFYRAVGFVTGNLEDIIKHGKHVFERLPAMEAAELAQYLASSVAVDGGDEDRKTLAEIIMTLVQGQNKPNGWQWQNPSDDTVSDLLKYSYLLWHVMTDNSGPLFDDILDEFINRDILPADTAYIAELSAEAQVA